jgi:hypothetical protein
METPIDRFQQGYLDSQCKDKCESQDEDYINGWVTGKEDIRNGRD